MTRTRSAASSPPRSASARCSSRRSRSSTTEIDRRVCKGELNVPRARDRRQADRAGAAARCDKIIADGKRMFAALDAALHAVHLARPRRGAPRVGRRRVGDRQGDPRRALQRDQARATSPSSARSPAAATRTRRPASGCARTSRSTAAARRGAPVVAVSVRRRSARHGASAHVTSRNVRVDLRVS